jgi:hypothetical protein
VDYRASALRITVFVTSTGVESIGFLGELLSRSSAAISTKRDSSVFIDEARREVEATTDISLQRMNAFHVPFVS